MKIVWLERNNITAKKRTIPLIQSELVEIILNMQALVKQMLYDIGKTKPRIARSKHLRISFDYLDKMRVQIHRRKFSELPDF